MPITVGQVISRARGRHWAFNATQMPDGAALEFLQERQRSLVLDHVDSIESLLSARTTLTIGGAVTLSTLTLPTDMLRFVAATADITDGGSTREIGIEILKERMAFAQIKGSFGRLHAYVASNRIIPLRLESEDKWDDVQKVNVDAVTSPALSALSDSLTLPAPLADALVADLAEFFATNSRECSEQDKQRFERQAASANARAQQFAWGVIAHAQHSHRVVRR